MTCFLLPLKAGLPTARTRGMQYSVSLALPSACFPRFLWDAGRGTGSCFFRMKDPKEREAIRVNFPIIWKGSCLEQTRQEKTDTEEECFSEPLGARWSEVVSLTFVWHLEPTCPRLEVSSASFVSGTSFTRKLQNIEFSLSSTSTLNWFF